MNPRRGRAARRLRAAVGRAAADLENGTLIVAVGARDAGNIELKDDLTRLTKSRVRFAVANRTDIETKINQVYRAEDEMHDLTSGLVLDEVENDDLACSPRSRPRRRWCGS